MDAYLFLVLNGNVVGGFRKIVPYASINDGKLDLFIIKKTPTIAGLLSVLPKVMDGAHLQDPRILCLQTDRLELQGPADVEIDIDGEIGPPFPLAFHTLPRRLQFYYVTGM